MPADFDFGNTILTIVGAGNTPADFDFGNTILTIVGAGGHARVLRDELALPGLDGLPMAQLLDKQDPYPANHQRAWVVGIGDNALRRKRAKEVDAFFAAYKANFGDAFRAGWLVLKAGHGKHALDLGTVVLNGAVISCDTKIGEHCILNHGCVVDHDVVLEDFVHVAPGAKMLGGSRAGEGAFIGANAVVLPGAGVPAWAIVRACSVYPADYASPFGKKPNGLQLKFQQGFKRA